VGAGFRGEVSWVGAGGWWGVTWSSVLSRMRLLVDAECIGVGAARLGLVVVYIHCACIPTMSRGLESAVCTFVLCMFLEVLKTVRYT
jgi:hypothetical protein